MEIFFRPGKRTTGQRMNDMQGKKVTIHGCLLNNSDKRHLFRHFTLILVDYICPLFIHLKANVHNQQPPRKSSFFFALSFLPLLLQVSFFSP